MNAQELWNRYKTHDCLVPAIDLSLDVSRMQIAASIGAVKSAERVYLVLEHLASNGRVTMARGKQPGLTTFAPG
jgi:hypothetical protein